MKVLVLDTVGVVGHAVAQYFIDSGHTVLGFGEQESPICKTFVGSYYDLDFITSIISNEQFDAVINCVAVINQDAEKDKSSASYINTFLPHFLAKITKGTKTVLVHRSTDCIFSGKKGKYTLQDEPDAESFYAKTKALGEVVNEKDITIRTSLIGPELDENGQSLFNWFFNQTGNVNGFANAIWTGLTTIEFAKEIEYLLKEKKHGLLQCVPEEKPLSKYELLLLFEEFFPMNRKVVKIENKLVDKSLLPQLSDSGLRISSYRQMIKEMLEFIKKHKNLYSHYFKGEEK